MEDEQESMTPEEQEKYRQEVRAKLEKENDEKVKARIRKEEETKAQGGPTVAMVKKLWNLATGK
jgi:hypothetical protein